jgi:hypothetical protein
MPDPRRSDPLECQGLMRLADARCCLDCEVLFTGLETCPSCASRAIWPLAAWLSPPLPHLSGAATPAGADGGGAPADGGTRGAARPAVRLLP